MKTYPIFLILFFCIGTLATAQIPTTGLVAYYSFDDCSLEDATGTSSNDGIVSGLDISCECGVSGQAIRLNVNENGVGQNDYSTVIFPGPLNDEFDDENFTLSFYFKPIGINGTMDIFSKRENCATESSFAIRYTAASNFINVVMSESNALNSSISYQLPFGQCWYHVVVWRDGTKARLYINGEEVQEVRSTAKVDLSNNEFVRLSGSPCIGVGDLPYDGLIDEIRMYNRALDKDEVASLYLAPERLANENSVNLYLGNSLDILPSSTCAHTIQWLPEDSSVDTLNELTPTITPTDPGIFTYEINYIDSFCVATDTIRINVIDPADLDCNLIFLPKAFTPNGHGPLENETYGISNPEAMEQLNSLEIFDRWGSVVFSTDSPFNKWDGRFKGQEVNPGVFLYKLSYVCKGEEQIKAGSLTLLR